MKILLTGGAGFIGSHLADKLIKLHQVEKLIVLDNLSTGVKKNIEHLIGHPNFEFVEGDIRSLETCKKVMRGCSIVSHQAALGSVPRSIKDPLTTNDVNVTGFLNILQASREENVKKVIYASSSSVYGDSPELPKYESRVGTPLSPYAVTKKISELYSEVFANQFGMNIIGFRYFNVFGPRQTPDGPYAAVIPLFMRAALSNNPPYINGDGSNSRDFTYIDNVVKANVNAILNDTKAGVHKVYNIACGQAITLNQLWSLIAEVASVRITPQFRPNRPGDIPHSLADISEAANDLAYNDLVSVNDGLVNSIKWYSDNF